jgi:acetolactate synthase-1/2/3 large subunit
MVKLTDYVVQFFVDRGVTDAFLVSGGGIMHLLDSVGRNPGMRYYCNYHEQACAIAAEGYGRATTRPGLCLGTTGPGAINAISGIMGAWVDSVPMVLLAGQVRTDIIADYEHVRQVGPQEGNSVGMAKPVTKYAVTIKDPRRVRYELEYAWHQVTTGRPGPVVLEFPLDVQGAMIDETTLESYVPEPAPAGRQSVADGVASVIDAIRRSKRPVFVAGNGVSISGSRDLLYQVLERTGIPILLPVTAKDLVYETHPQYMGIFGGAGQRRANFTIQNSDCLIGLAAGFNLQKTGFNIAGFAPKARRVFVDIDEGQLKYQPFKADLTVQADIREFFPEFLRQSESIDLRPSAQWLDACARWKSRYPVMLPEYYENPDYVNTYVAVDALSDAMDSGDQLLTGNGTEVASCYQAFRVKPGQRVYISGWGAMGWDLPLVVGTCIGSGRKRTICVTGDGSLQWNVQELLTIRNYNLPVKLFICNNAGYTYIRSTQKNFFQGHFVGSDAQSGVVNPDFSHLAAAYGFHYLQIRNNGELRDGIAQAFAHDGPVLCEMNVAVEQPIFPRVSSFRRDDGTFESRPIEDMAPFLPREEVWENMHLFDQEDAVVSSR